MAFIDFFDSKEFEWADLSIAVSGAPLLKLRGFGANVENDLEHLFAAGNKAFSIQAGNKKTSGRLAFLFGAFMDLWTASVAAGGDDPTDVEVDIIGTVVKAGTRKQYSVVCEGVRFSVAGFDTSQGDKYVEVELPFLALSLKLTQA